MDPSAPAAASTATGSGRADLHMHTTHSDGMFNAKTIINYLAAINESWLLRYGHSYLDVIAITDHDTLRGSMDAREYNEQIGRPLEVLSGVEVSTASGHVVALNVTEEIPARLSTAVTIDKIHAQGGVAIAAHPYSSLILLGVKSVGGKIKRLPFDGIEVVNSNITEMWGNRYTAMVNRLHQNLSEIGSSDAHFLSAFEKVYTLFPGKSAADLLAAILARQTRAHGAIYGIHDLIDYVRDRRALDRYCREHGIHPHNL